MHKYDEMMFKSLLLVINYISHRIVLNFLWFEFVSESIVKSTEDSYWLYSIYIQCNVLRPT